MPHKVHEEYFDLKATLLFKYNNELCPGNDKTLLNTVKGYLDTNRLYDKGLSPNVTKITRICNASLSNHFSVSYLTLFVQLTIAGSLKADGSKIK